MENFRTILQSIYVFLSSFELWAEGGGKFAEQGQEDVSCFSVPHFHDESDACCNLPGGFGGQVVKLVLDAVSSQNVAFALEQLVLHLDSATDLALSQREGIVSVIAKTGSTDPLHTASISMKTLYTALLKLVVDVGDVLGLLALRD